MLSPDRLPEDGCSNVPHRFINRSSISSIDRSVLNGREDDDNLEGDPETGLRPSCSDSESARNDDDEEVVARFVVVAFEGDFDVPLPFFLMLDKDDDECAFCANRGGFTLDFSEDDG